MEEVFPGYQESINGLRGAMSGADVATAPPTRSGGMDVMGLMQQMLMSQAEPAKTAEKPIPRWLWAIPGAAKGIAMRKQMDTQDEELKLRKQTLAGQQAQQKLQQIALMQKIQQQQATKRWGGLYSGLVQHDDVLDETAKSELEGQLVREMAEGGDPEKIEKFLEARKSQKLLKRFDAMEQQFGLSSDSASESPQATVPAPGSPDPTATSTAPQRKPGGGYAQVPPMLRERIDRAVTKAAQETGLDPSEIYGIMQAESNFDPQAESVIYDKQGKRIPGAIGLMQLMPGTAAGLKVDPHNLEQNVSGGARYYAQMKARYKDPRLALAAYNAGPGRVDAAGGVPNIAETQGYVPRALKAMGRFLSPGSAQAQTNSTSSATTGLTPDPAANESWQRDKLKLVGLQEQAKKYEKALAGTAPLEATKEGKARRDAWQSSLKDLKGDIQTLEKKTAFTGHTVEQIIGVPINYATPGQMSTAAQTLETRADRRSERQGMQAAERQAQATELAAQKTYDATVAKNKAEIESAPLSEGMAERVSNLNTIIHFVNEVATLRQNNFTGRIEGYLGAVREFTGDITKDEVQFRALLQDAKDLQVRARSGAAITDKEDQNFAKLLPNVGDPPGVFIAKLERFGKAIETARDEKVKLATTPRGKLLDVMPRVGQSATKPSTADLSMKPAKELTLEEAKQELERLQKQGK